MSGPGALPSAYSEERLRKNFLALQRVAPELAERVALPVDGSKVSFDARGEAAYRLHRTHLPLGVEREAARLAAARAGEADRVVVFGLGLGEAVEALLAAPSKPRVLAWERDPWLLRLFLMRCDVAAALAARRLELWLGADLLAHAPLEAGIALVEHPLLARVYRRERRLLEHGLRERRAALAEGGLLVDALGRALEARGLSVYTLDLQGLAREELELSVRRLRPELVAAINYTNGLAEFCAAEKLPLLCWEIDPAPEPPRPAAGPTAHVRLFTYRRALVERWWAAGFERVEYLPLAADPELRAPVELEQAERQRFAAPISFVGSSLVDQARAMQKSFLEAWAAWRTSAGRRPAGAAPAADTRETALAEGRGLIEDLLARQREDFGRLALPELLRERVPEFLAAEARRRGAIDPAVLLSEMAAAEKRLSWAASLGGMGLALWGDAGWKLALDSGARWCGPAGNDQELNRIYCASRVNLDIGRLYQSDIATLRVFDILACGGFALAEHTPELAELFQDGVELRTYAGRDELAAKARWCLDHPAETADMAARGRNAVLERHTVAARVDHMLASPPAAAAAGARGLSRG